MLQRQLRVMADRISLYATLAGVACLMGGVILLTGEVQLIFILAGALGMVVGFILRFIAVQIFIFTGELRKGDLPNLAMILVFTAFLAFPVLSTHFTANRIDLWAYAFFGLITLIGLEDWFIAPKKESGLKG